MKAHEKWKAIEGYEGAYEVSNFGNVRSVDRDIVYSNGRVVSYKGNTKKQTVDKYGYAYVGLYSNQKHKQGMTHRLVAKAFIPNIDNKPQVNHIDGNKTNNNVENLEWVTPHENYIHAVKNGLSDSKASLNIANKVRLHKPFAQYTLDGEFIRKYNNYNEMEDITGFKRQCVAKCCHGTYKTSHGYLWRFI